MTAQATKEKARILILGGSVSGLATALALTNDPDWSNKYIVTMFQEKWAPCGKLASGRDERDPSVIVEHGLHVLFAFYSNTIDLLRRTYEELGLDIDDAFHGVDRIHFAQEIAGEWTIAPLSLGTPSKLSQVSTTPLPKGLALTMALLNMIIDWVKANRLEAFEAAKTALALPMSAGLAEVRNAFANDSVTGANAIAYPHLLQRALADGMPAAEVQDLIRDVLALFVKSVTQPPLGTTEFYEYCVLCLIVAVTLAPSGLTSTGTPVTIESLEGLDFRAWLTTLGFSSDVVSSAVVNAAYNLLFAEKLSAATAIQGGIAMAMKPGFYAPNCTMAEALLAPMCELLMRRGIRLKFYHRVRDIKAPGGMVSTVELEQQAEVGADFDPLMPHVEGDPEWRRSFRLESPYKLFENGPRVVLRAGRDFDHVVVALPLPALEKACPSLLAHDRKLRRAVKHLGTTATASAQVYLSRSFDAGTPSWKPRNGVLANCLPQFSTFADMTASLPASKGAARGLVYLCGATSASETATKVVDDARSWIDAMPDDLWPVTDGDRGIRAILGRANTAPEDRYILSLPDTERFRPNAGPQWIRNLSYVGDWVCVPGQLCAGCVESAVISGVAAAASINAAMTTTQSPKAQTKAIGAASNVPFIAAPDESSWPGPFVYNTATLYSFFINCDLATLQGICDLYLNLGADSTLTAGYRALGSFAIVQCAQSLDATTMATGNNFQGFLQSHAMSITIPVAYCDIENGAHVAQKLCLFTPYIFADKSVEVAAGREIFGCAKRLGVFTADNADWRSSLSFGARSEVIPLGGGQLAMQPVLNVACSGTGSPSAQTTLPNLIVDLIQRLETANVLSPEFGQQAFQRLLLNASAGAGIFYLVGLKQFRDAQNTLMACYQQVVETPIHWTGQPTGYVFDETQFAVTLPADYETLSMPERLTLPAATAIPVFGAYRFDFDAYIMGQLPSSGAGS